MGVKLQFLAAAGVAWWWAAVAPASVLSANVYRSQDYTNMCYSLVPDNVTAATFSRVGCAAACSSRRCGLFSFNGEPGFVVGRLQRNWANCTVKLSIRKGKGTGRATPRLPATASEYLGQVVCAPWAAWARSLPVPRTQSCTFWLTRLPPGSARPCPSLETRPSARISGQGESRFVTLSLGKPRLRNSPYKWQPFG